MSAKIISLEERKFVRRFVDIYTKEGETAAGKYAHDQGLGDNDKDMVRYRAEIKKEFLRRGYTFPKPQHQPEVG
jgi:hypothetical protein